MKRALTVVLAVAFAAAPARAQTVKLSYILFPKPDSVQHPTLVRGAQTAFDDMKAALSDMVVAQETYFSTHDAYTTDGKALDIFPTKHGQAQTTVTFAGTGGWMGTATEPSLKGKSCVIYVGPVSALPNGPPKTLGGVVATKEGVPACDEP